jgi:hypothetical protein
MYKILTLLAIATSVNFGLATSQASAQLSPQQCADDLNQIFGAFMNGSISQAEFAAIANQHNYENPECSQYISGPRITSEQLEMQRESDQQHLENMNQLGQQQVETYKEFVNQME